MTLIVLVIGLYGCTTGNAKKNSGHLEPQATSSTTPIPTDPGAFQWGAQHATPGVTIRLQEEERTTVGGKTQISYSVKTSGLPREKRYKVWLYSLIDSLNKRAPTLASPLEWSVDGNGRLSLSRGAVLRFEVPGYLKGEWLEVGVISIDGTDKAFAKTLPFPIEAKEGPCRLWLELASLAGDIFTLFGEGFTPDEEMDILWSSEMEVLPSRSVVPADGSFIGILVHGVIEKSSGSGVYSVKTKSCNPVLTYQWGRAALTRQ